MVNLFVNENLFLIVIGLIWIIGAVVQDLRRREVDNLWNFSLIAIALAYRFSLSAYNGNYWFFINGLIGFGIFLILGNIFYYSRIFAGGDAKLLIALGAVLPLSYDWIFNVKIFGLFIMGFLIGGGIYVLIWSLVLMVVRWRDFSNEYRKQFNVYKHVFSVSLILMVLMIIVGIIIDPILLIISLVFLMFPVLFVYSKAVEESCMIRKVLPKDLTVGDWLYEDIFVRGKKIEKSWDGVSESQLEMIQKKYNRKILVKYGVPFTPSFLIGFLLVLWFNWVGLI